jgi:predicted transposase YbfD/YdcC
MLDGDAVAKVIVGIMREKSESLGTILAVDGKTMRGTSVKGRPHSALQMLTAYLTESGVVLGQEAVWEKTNEIPVFQDMLAYLDIGGKTVAADAMHCQKDTCRAIIGKGGDYVFGLKGNQGLLYEEVREFVRDEASPEFMETFTTIEKSGGRGEKRICKKIPDISRLHSGKEWVGLQSVFAIQRITVTKGRRTDETGYYITSLDVSAEELLRISREHWKVESMHWLLDVTFSEDACKVESENGNKTLNILRKLALLVHRQHLAKQTKKISVKANLLKCLISEDRLIELIESL